MTKFEEMITWVGVLAVVTLVVLSVFLKDIMGTIKSVEDRTIRMEMNMRPDVKFIRTDCDGSESLIEVQDRMLEILQCMETNKSDSECLKEPK